MVFAFRCLIPTRASAPHKKSAVIGFPNGTRVRVWLSLALTEEAVRSRCRVAFLALARKSNSKTLPKVRVSQRSGEVRRRPLFILAKNERRGQN